MLLLLLLLPFAAVSARFVLGCLIQVALDFELYLAMIALELPKATKHY